MASSNKMRLAAISFFLIILTSLNLMFISSSTSSSPLLTQISEKRHCFFLHKYWIYITNNLPEGSPPLHAHCYSGDDELGNRTMNVNDQIRWDFCNQPYSTLYSCGFVWKNRFAAFEVFNSLTDNKCSPEDLCYYSVQESGFYFSAYNPPRDLKFFRNW